jgi:transcription-repair coupling factor (superfamily II helicase)
MRVFFFGALEGASEAAVDVAVLPFPSLQVDPYRGMTPHFRVAAARARALHAAASGTARLVVASAAALLPRVSRADRLLRASIELRAGLEIEPQRLADLLVDAGFTREDPVEEHGAFTLRGGIVDVFPAADAEPVRIEFVGDMVETLRRYDPATQRSTGPTDQVHIVPARERFDDEDLVPVLDCLSESQHLRLLISEYEQVEQQITKTQEQLENSYRDASARGHVSAPPPDVAFSRWDDLQERASAASRLEELALEDDAAVHHVSCQPALEFRGRVGDWAADLRQARERGDTIIFVADSVGRAERTAEILRDYEIVALPIDHPDAASSASVLIAIGTFSRGFRLASAALQLYAETDVFEEERRATERRRSVAQTFLSNLRDLKVGDLVVHVDHGIGEFVG